MWRWIAFALALSCPSLIGFASVSYTTNSPADKFQPAEPLSAFDVEYPPQSIAFGTVVLQASVDESGKIIQVNVVRPIASLTDEASRSVAQWKFKPAKMGGKPVASFVTVAVTFNPAVNNPEDVPLPTEQIAEPPNEENSKRTLYMPPSVTSATFSIFPLGGVVYGSVALDVEVGAKGEIAKVHVLRDIVSLSDPAVKAVKKWKFAPAQFEGAPVAARIVVVFVSRLPATR